MLVARFAILALLFTCSTLTQAEDPPSEKQGQILLVRGLIDSFDKRKNPNEATAVLLYRLSSTGRKTNQLVYAEFAPGEVKNFTKSGGEVVWIIGEFVKIGEFDYSPCLFLKNAKEYRVKLK